MLIETTKLEILTSRPYTFLFLSLSFTHFCFMTFTLPWRTPFVLATTALHPRLVYAQFSLFFLHKNCHPYFWMNVLSQVLCWCIIWVAALYFWQQFRNISQCRWRSKWSFGTNWREDSQGYNDTKREWRGIPLYNS